MTDAHGVARDQLRAFIERIERLEEEKKSIADDIKDVYGEAKGTGFDTKVLREVIKIRKQDRDERAEREAILDSYLIALGMIDQPSFFDDEPRQSAPVERQPAMALRSDGGLSILTKHEDIRSDGSPSVSSSLTTREAEESVVPHLPVTAEELQHPVPHATGANARSGGDGSTVRGARTEADAVTAGETAPNSQSDDGAIAAVNGKAGLANAAGVEPPSSVQIDPPEDRGEGHSLDGNADANKGGNDVESSALRAGLADPTSNTGEGAANTALPAKPKVSFRPNCQHPENCASGTRDHCWSCRRAMQKSEEMA